MSLHSVKNQILTSKNFIAKVFDTMEAKIYDKATKSLIDVIEITSTHSVTTWAKQQLSLLVNDKSGFVINELRYRNTGGTWSTISVSTSRNNNTLLVESGTITSPATYDTWRCSNSGAGTNYHNEILSTITVGTDQELVVTMKFVFTGLNNYGNYVLASLLGAVGDAYDATINAISYRRNGTLNLTYDISKVSSGNTFKCSINPNFPLTNTGTYDAFGANAYNVGDYIFHEFSGATVELGTNQELLVREVFVFN